jgi:hypothetical protein
MHAVNAFMGYLRFGRGKFSFHGSCISTIWDMVLPLRIDCMLLLSSLRENNLIGLECHAAAAAGEFSNNNPNICVRQHWIKLSSAWS